MLPKLPRYRYRRCRRNTPLSAPKGPLLEWAFCQVLIVSCRGEARIITGFLFALKRHGAVLHQANSQRAGL